MYSILLVAILNIFLISSSSSNLVSSKAESNRYIVGYLFPRDSLINENDIAAEKLTHINYAFANIKEGKISQGFKNDIQNFKILNETKKRNPNLKILISVGGWTWSGGFSDMSLTRESRVKFINSAIDFIKNNNLDGIDIDWEFPNLIGYGNVYRPEDKENFTSLVRELRIALDHLGTLNKKHYWLTAASGSFDNYLTNTEIDKVQDYVDFVNLMAYDFYEPDADSIIGHNSPLYSNPRDPNHNSADAMIQKYIAAGVAPEKIVLGVPFYGHVWHVFSTDYQGLYEPGGPVKKHIRGSFKNIVLNILNDGSFIRYWDSTSCVPYLFNDKEKIFITYEDEESLKAKCKYIDDHGLKGAMFWEYTSDYQSRLLNTLFGNLGE